MRRGSLENYVLSGKDASITHTKPTSPITIITVSRSDTVLFKLTQCYEVGMLPRHALRTRSNSLLLEGGGICVDWGFTTNALSLD